MPDELMTEQDAVSVLDELQNCVIHHDDDALLPIALTNRILATYHAHARLVAENASLQASAEGWSTVALKAEGERDAALAQLAEAQKDVARVDALEKLLRIRAVAAPIDGVNLSHDKLWWLFADEDKDDVSGATLRECVDAAMQEGKDNG